MHCKQTHNFYKRIVSRIMYFRNVMTVYSCSFCSKNFWYVKPFNFVIIKHFEIKQLYNSKFSTNERGCVWSYEFYDPIWTRYAFIKTIIPFLQVSFGQMNSPPLLYSCAKISFQMCFSIACFSSTRMILALLYTFTKHQNKNITKNKQENSPTGLEMKVYPSCLVICSFVIWYFIINLELTKWYGRYIIWYIGV